MAGLVLNKGVKRREAVAWAAFDFANSGYTTVVITAIYSAYFVAVIAGGAAWATLLWSGALALSSVLIMGIGPALGAWADAGRGRKKVLLWTTTLLCAAATVALGWAGPGQLVLALSLLVMSHLAFGLGENVIAAFLPELARGRGLGRLSGFGWGVGYLGGLLTLGVCLWWVDRGQALGQTAVSFVPGTLAITAGLFVVAALPTFIWLRERGGGRVGAAPLLAWRHLQAFPDLRRFLWCIVAYQSGVQAVIALAAIYAQQAMGFDTRQSIVLIAVVNVTAAVGAVVFGFAQDRIGAKATLMITLVGWLLTIVLAWAATDAAQFWWAAILAGLCLGASQSAGRAMVAYLSPRTRQAEFLGLWGMAVKLSAIVGPMLYGAVVWLSDGQHRFAMLILAPFFMGGLILLARVDMRRGRRAAGRAGR
jgi:MFS transporter, UMF1 family